MSTYALATGVLLFQSASCLGWGFLLVRACGGRLENSPAEQLFVAFAAGVGVLGWTVFFVGIAGGLHEPGVGLLLAAGLPGLYLFFGNAGDANRAPVPQGAAPWAWLLAFGFGLAAVCDLLEATTPPTDIDSLSYHFALIKQFSQSGRIEFVPRAVDGAVPLLVQMTYLPAFILGGELAMTLWAGLTGWAAAGLAFVLCRRYLNVVWSAGVALVLITTPAVVYGGGSGQVEVRIAMFVALCAYFLIVHGDTGLRRYLFLAGVAAGLFAASKYTGLLFLGAAGLFVVARYRAPKDVLLFSLGAAIAGVQWYVWNWHHTGDPVFPLLFSVLDYRSGAFWDLAHAEHFKKAFFEAEAAVPKTVFEFLLYPFRATFAPPSQFEAGRVGLGPYAILLFPFAVAAAWRWRARILKTSALPMLALCAVFLVLWFFIGSSQRVRHLLPIYPLVLVLVSTAAIHWATSRQMAAPVAAAMAMCLALQFGAHGFFTVNFARYHWQNESRLHFLTRNIPLFSPVPWINRNLGKDDLLLLDTRFLAYVVDKSYFFAHPSHQALVDVLPNSGNARKFYSQISRLGVTHILVSNWLAKGPEKRIELLGMTWNLIDAGCAEVIRTFQSRRFSSRTLPNMKSETHAGAVVRLTKQTCHVDRLLGDDGPQPSH